jgi:hypothetical protein
MSDTSPKDAVKAVGNAGLLKNCQSKDKSVRNRALRAAFFEVTGNVSAHRHEAFKSFVAGIDFASRGVIGND